MTPALPQLVIFDCDGVLVDSEPLSNAVLAAALTAEGLEMSPAQAEATFKGRHIDDVIARAEEDLGHPLPPDFVPSYEHARAEAFRRELRAVPGAGDMVRAVRAAGIAVCVASQGKVSKTELTLGLTGLRPLFGPDAVFSAHDVPRGKPHPDLFLHAAERMGSAPEHTAVVEDTPIGVTAAVGAGMRAIGYAGAGPDDAARLRDAGAEVVTSLSDVAERLGLTAALRNQ